MSPRAWAKPGFLDPRMCSPAHTGQYRDSPVAPDVAGLPACRFTPEPKPGPWAHTWPHYRFPRLMVTQGRVGQARPVGESAAEMEDPVKVSSKGRPDSFASWLLSVPTPVPAAGTWFQITYSKTFTPRSRVGRPRLSDGLPPPPTPCCRLLTFHPDSLSPTQCQGPEAMTMLVLETSGQLGPVTLSS